MQEQAMVTDALNSINNGIKSLSDMITQTDNQELRQTLQQMRNQSETCQYELYTIAKSKNYYQPAKQVSQQEIADVKNTINSIVSQ
ncbi:spore coat protein [Anaerocolumna aminovalerica]|uniref:Coat F domain-containing protein n=1 Tax=Anaerocolumna aminovalerica TaxID=1527 RepID=A0A1I5EXV7_9FIRM|nr:spore coat protein [Anaerocolumna aminovalerica]MBU5332057.1 spore coat protein [Anaerocolumna aminovalerica]MDU6265044.1 spore coat protein [Anaerocolumna aminovalerica]SFO16287.1 Coat F domain-containing protein [Anaerocolumna aminovalerica]